MHAVFDMQGHISDNNYILQTLSRQLEITTRHKKEKQQQDQTPNYFKAAQCFLVYFWLLTRRTITRTIPIHQSIIRLPGRLQNKHTVGVILYHNFPATTSDKMRASRIQEKLSMQISALKILQLPYSTLKCGGKP